MAASATSLSETASPGGGRVPAIWFRVLLPHGSLGPGKLALLRLVGETGSVSAAAKRLRMSHARSVKLIAELNALGPEPVVATRIGGPSGGGAVLTEAGRRLLASYERLDAAVHEAAAAHILELQRALGAS